MDYNGMKMVRKDARPISGDSGLFTIRDFASVAEKPIEVGGALKIAAPDKSACIEHLLSYVDSKRLKPLKFVVNAGNGGTRLILDLLAPNLPFEFVRIQHNPDGSLPNGIPNPLLPENRSATADAVKAHNSDFGVAWGGDFDRCFFFDAGGTFIEGYYLVGLLAQVLLPCTPNERIIHDPRLIRNTVEMVLTSRGTPIMSKAGHAFIKESMPAEDAIYGSEMNAHHYFSGFSYCDSGMIPWLLIADLVSATGLPLAKLISDRIHAFPCSGGINFQVEDTAATIQRVMIHYAPLSPLLDHTDGISADFGDWRFDLRSSNTEPLLRLNVETCAAAALLVEHTSEPSALIGGQPPSH